MAYPASALSEMTRTSDVAVDAAQAPSVAARLASTAQALGADVARRFEVFRRAGLVAPDAFRVACCGATVAEARALSRDLLASSSLRGFATRRIAAHVLGEVVAVGRTVGADEMQAMLRAHDRTFVVRPDGWLVHGLSDRAVMRAGPVEVRDGAVVAGPFTVGGLARYEDSHFWPMAADGSAVREPALGLERALEHDLANRALDGAGDALAGVVEGVAQALTDPVRTVHELGRLPESAAALLRASPALFERFSVLPLGDQVQAASEIAYGALLGARLGSGAVRASEALPGAVRRGTEVMVTGLGEASGQAVRVWRLEGAALAVTGAGLGEASVGAVFLAKALDPGGPKSSLPEVEDKAAASLKRAERRLDKAEAAELKKLLPRVDANRKALIERLDGLLQREWTERTEHAFRSARNALRDHGSQGDLTGALRDRLGIPVRLPGEGTPYDHLNEVQDMMNSLESARASLVFELGAGARRGQVDREIQSALHKLDSLVKDMTRFAEGPK